MNFGIIKGIGKVASCVGTALLTVSLEEILREKLREARKAEKAKKEEDKDKEEKEVEETKKEEKND